MLTETQKNGIFEAVYPRIAQAVLDHVGSTKTLAADEKHADMLCWAWELLPGQIEKARGNIDDAIAATVKESAKMRSRWGVPRTASVGLRDASQLNDDMTKQEAEEPWYRIDELPRSVADVASRLARGMTRVDIAKELGLHRKTIEKRVALLETMVLNLRKVRQHAS